MEELLKIKVEAPAKFKEVAEPVMAPLKVVGPPETTCNVLDPPNRAMGRANDATVVNDKVPPSRAKDKEFGERAPRPVRPKVPLFVMLVVPE